MIPLTHEENELYKMQKVFYIFKKIFITHKNNKNVFKLYNKVREIIVITPENLEKLLILFAI